MKIQRFVAAAALLSIAGAASAADSRTRSSNLAPDAFTVRGDANAPTTAFGPQPGKKTLQWDAAKGRWGLSLDMSQPVDREVQLRDMQAGAFYRITPSLRIGGAVSLDGATADPRKTAPQEQAPKVRLETAFKF